MIITKYKNLNTFLAIDGGGGGNNFNGYDKYNYSCYLRQTISTMFLSFSTFL